VSRRSFTPSDSLDMLLDTMCNTFGGIILIALLISLLARDEPTPSTPTESGVSADQRRQDYLQAVQHHEQLEREYAKAAPTLALLEQVAKLREQVELATATHADVQKNAAEWERKVREAQEAKRRLVSQLSDLNRHIEVATEDLTNVVTKKAGEIRVPMRRKASGQMSWNVVVKGGRLFPVETMVQGQMQLNRSLFNITQVPPFGTDLEPIPDRGIQIKGNIEAFRRLLMSVSPKRYVVMFPLYGDSFSDFPALRDMVVEKGFGYDVLLLAPGERLVAGPGGGAATRVN